MDRDRVVDVGTDPSRAQLREDAQARGIKVLADDVSLRQRGLLGDRVAKEVTVTNVGDLVDLLMERSDKVIWH